jgi:DNA invertase Pin-like site-specific DNA recombinase
MLRKGQIMGIAKGDVVAQHQGINWMFGLAASRVFAHPFRTLHSVFATLPNLLADWCERGVRVVVVTQQLDLHGAVGRMVASVLFGLAEIEAEYRRERQAADIAAAKRNGVYRGRQRETTKAKPARARALRARGLTIPEIAQTLGLSPRTTFRYLAEAHHKPV